MDKELLLFAVKTLEGYADIHVNDDGEKGRVSNAINILRSELHKILE